MHEIKLNLEQVKSLNSGVGSCLGGSTSTTSYLNTICIAKIIISESTTSHNYILGVQSPFLYTYVEHL